MAARQLRVRARALRLWGRASHSWRRCQQHPCLPSMRERAAAAGLVLPGAPLSACCSSAMRAGCMHPDSPALLRAAALLSCRRLPRCWRRRAPRKRPSCFTSRPPTCLPPKTAPARPTSATSRRAGGGSGEDGSRLAGHPAVGRRLAPARDAHLIWEAKSRAAAAAACAQIAGFAAELERYPQAIKIYEDVARACVDNNLLKYRWVRPEWRALSGGRDASSWGPRPAWQPAAARALVSIRHAARLARASAPACPRPAPCSAKGHLLNAGICQLAGADLHSVRAALERYAEIDLNFEHSREANFLAVRAPPLPACPCCLHAAAQRGAP